MFLGKYRQRTCAIKLIFTVDLTQDVIKRIRAEAQLLSYLQHPNVVDIIGVAVLPPSVCIVLEFCQYGSLADVLKCVRLDTSPGLPISAVSVLFPAAPRYVANPSQISVLSWADRLFLAGILSRDPLFSCKVFQTVNTI